MKTAKALKITDAGNRTKTAALAAAVLPLLVLFAALTAVLSELFSAPMGAALLLPGALIVILCAFLPGRSAAAAPPLLALAAVCALLLLPAARGGAMALANRLYAMSEARNAYAYLYFENASDAAAALNAALLCASLALGALCALAGRSRTAALALFLGTALLEGFFGVTPALLKNILLFAAFGYLLLRGAGLTGALAVLLACALVLACALTLAPRPDGAVEAYSEHLRDELGLAAMRTAGTLPPSAADTGATRRESRLREEAANEDPNTLQNRRDYDLQTETEQEISLPHRTNWLRVILLFLLLIALLVVPFVPFLMLNRARRRAAEKRAAFADADNAAAARAMFRHTVEWLRACGMETENRPFALCADAAQALISADYAARYAAAAGIWEEAAYSDHPISDEKRELVREVMEETEKTLYASADRRGRLRLKYVKCLCEV